MKELFSNVQFLIIWLGEGKIAESIGEYRNGILENEDLCTYGRRHMEVQFFPLTQTMPCHCSIICPVSPSGKQSMSFRELLCFPFTVTDKDQMNQGLFVEGQNERKKENDSDFSKS